MSNWDLMMPGMGLTAIGLAGVTISYSGIAHTFIDGMHALTGLTMFIGLIFLAAGILDGGISTSKRAKVTTVIIMSIALGFGMFALGTMNTSDYTVSLAVILMAIAFTASLIAYLAMKHSTLTKPIGSIVGIAATTGIIMWLAFGIVSTDTNMISEQVGIEEPSEGITLTKPIFAIQILKDSAVEGNPDYSPDVSIVTQGYVVEWTNEDPIAHTVTSLEGFGELFDSSMMNEGDVFTLDTTNLEIGEYEYICSFHSWMVATLVIEEPKEPVTVIIPEGAALLEDGQIYYDPQVIDVTAGTTVAWDNADSAVHTVTSGEAPVDADGMFDSEMMMAGDVFEFTFTEVGNYDYYCAFHPWMIGTVNVE